MHDLKREELIDPVKCFDEAVLNFHYVRNSEPEPLPLVFGSYEESRRFTSLDPPEVYIADAPQLESLMAYYSVDVSSGRYYYNIKGEERVLLDDVPGKKWCYNENRWPKSKLSGQWWFSGIATALYVRTP